MVPFLSLGLSLTVRFDPLSRLDHRLSVDSELQSFETSWRVVANFLSVSGSDSQLAAATAVVVVVNESSPPNSLRYPFKRINLWVSVRRYLCRISWLLQLAAGQQTEICQNSAKSAASGSNGKARWLQQRTLPLFVAWGFIVRWLRGCRSYSLPCCIGCVTEAQSPAGLT